MDNSKEAIASYENDDNESTDSSLCIIMTEELDQETNQNNQIESDDQKEREDIRNTDKENPDNGNEDTADSFSAMTQSQYAQVVFHDVSDSYPNDSDIILSFTLTTNVPLKKTRDNSNGSISNCSDSTTSFSRKIAGDRIGIFKVPFVSPSDILKFEWVTETDCTNEGGLQDVGTVVFKACDLPKEEDFFQFQYLRVSEDASQNILGASIPFQLRKPKNEELCAVQNASEFMVVQTTTALASGQFSEKLGSLEAEKSRLHESLNRTTHDYGRLLELSENLTEQLEDKSLSFIQLEKNYHHRKLDLDQTKSDLACVIQDKLQLEERLQRSNELVKTLQNKQDNLYGDCQKKDREIALLKEERDRITARADDTRQLLSVMTESKEVATKLVKSHIVRADNFQKELELMKIELESKSKLEEKVKELTSALELSQEELKQAKEKCPNQTIMVDRSVHCKEESVRAINPASIQESGTNTEPMEHLDNTKCKSTTALTDSSYERELELDEAFQTRCSNASDEQNDSSRINELENRLLKLQDYLRSTEKAHNRKINDIKEDILSIKSSCTSSEAGSVLMTKNHESGKIDFPGRTQALDYSLDSDNSLRFLDYDLIGREINKSNNGSSTKLRENMTHAQSDTTSVKRDCSPKESFQQEEPLNLTTDDIDRKVDLKQCQNKSENDKDKFLEDARGNIDSNDQTIKVTEQMEDNSISISNSTGASRRNPPLSIDMPSIGTVAALSTAAVVSPVVAIAAVGYGVAKILSGNQANGESQANENGEDSNEYNEYGSNVGAQCAAIVTEPNKTSKIPARDMKIERDASKEKDQASSHNAMENSDIHRAYFPTQPSEPRSSGSQLPEPLMPQQTDSSKLAAKQGSIKGLQELCKGLFWSSEDLSIPSANNSDSQNDRALDTPWCTNDLASVHSRLRTLDEATNKDDSVAENNIDLQRFGPYNDDTSIRVFPAELNNDESSEHDATFQLTDDGRAIEVPSTRGEDDDDFNIGIRETEEDNGNLSCPICHLEFERTPENAQNLVAHVDEHLVEELKCPVCFITFNKSHQNAYENHVNSHFNDANDYVEIEGENNAASAPVREETDEEDRNRPRFWFIDNID